MIGLAGYGSCDIHSTVMGLLVQLLLFTDGNNGVVGVAVSGKKREVGKEEGEAIGRLMVTLLL